MNRFLTGFVLLFVCFFEAYAQKGLLKFSEMEFDFGNIKEENGAAIHEFKFTNVGIDTILIENVQASCGCTTPDWTKTPVLPGQSGIIKASFDANNRPGPFNKSLTVTANTNPPSNILFVKGNVIPRFKLPAEQFPDKIGHLRLTSRGINLGSIKNDKPAQADVEVYNDGDKVLSFTNHTIAPEHIKIQYIPEKLAPKSKGIIRVIYDPKKKNDYGFVSDYVEVFTDETEDFKKTLSVFATIEEYFPPMTQAELLKAPKAKFNKVEHNFGTIKQGDKVSVNFVLTNAGRGDLLIRRTKVTCGCTSSDAEKNVVKAGESTNVNVVFDSAGKDGNQSKTVVVFTNDPTSPSITLTIKATVRR